MKPFLYGILAILLFSIPLSADSASSLNQEGLDLYRAGKFGPALQKFEKAVEVKPDYAWGHYNLACTLGVIRKKGDICEHNAYKGRIVEHLTKAVKLLPRLKNKFRNDPDLKPIHDTIGYRKLLGYSLLNPRHLNHFIRHVSWFGPAPGAYGHISGISFGKRVPFPSGTWIYRVNQVSLKENKFPDGITFRVLKLSLI